jgi:predicted nuclease with TOPRIM domain
MPRTKGSKNKTTGRSVEERMTAVSAEIETLQEQLREKREELKQLNVEKAEEDKQKLLGAVAASGKTIEEILSLIQQADEEKPIQLIS